MIKPGDRAPDFELPDADMALVSLAQFNGKQHVVLYFYVRDNTPGCTTQAIEFSDLEADFAKRDCVILGVSRDDCISHGVFRDKHGISVRLLADKDSVTCRAYGVLQEKEVDGAMRESVNRSTFIIDKTGIVRHVLAGVTPKGHAADILNLVKGL
jgi:peroxiredoxin Q/BCP